MMKSMIHGGAWLLLAGLLATGCNKPATPSGAKKDDKKGTEVAKKGDHSGWWCTEHGIPEEECSMCSEKVAKAFKDKGDWCKVHPDRAASQCFICNPKQAEVYAAKYRAKYDKEPPPAEENMPKDAPKKEEK
jgi:hypothetical protein